MSYRNISNPFGYSVQDGGGDSLDLAPDTIVGGKVDKGSMGNKASIPLTVPPVYPVDDAETNFNFRSPVYGNFEHSSNTFIIDPTEPVDDNGFPGQHPRLTYVIVAWISKIPGGDSNFLPGKNYIVRVANTTYYNEFTLAQDYLWATDAYTNMPSAYMMNGNSVNGRNLILGQTSGNQSEVRFFNLALVRNDGTTFSDYSPGSVGSVLNALPGTEQFQTFIPPESEAYWTSTRWRMFASYPRSADGTYSKIPGS